MNTSSSAKLRVDKWLWYSRVVKTRSLAQAIVKSGKVRVNGTKISSPSSAIAPDDVLTITLDRRIAILKVIALGVRRGPAPEAQLLYEDLSPPPVKKTDATSSTARVAPRDEGAGRPTKKQRRDMDRFRLQADPREED